jgi:hypothetical protein
MSTTVNFRNHGERQPLTSVVIEALSVIPNFFASLQKAMEASRDFERLSHLTDAELESRGLTREGVTQYISAKYFAD